MAAGFAVGLNGALAATFLFPHFVHPWGRTGSWVALTIVWLVCFRRAVGRLSQFYCGDGRYNDELFSRAQEEYLRGQWGLAESLLLRLLRDEPADVEGRLLLATLYRRTQQPDQARAQLDQLERYPHAGRWRWEIHQERNYLQRPVAPAGLNAGESVLAPDQPDQAPRAEDMTENRGDGKDDADRGENDHFPGAEEQRTATKGNSAGRGGLSKAA
jgi:hypothetical protein